MSKKPSKKRAVKYEPKIQLKEGIEFNDLINLSLQSDEKKPSKKSTKK